MTLSLSPIDADPGRNLFLARHPSLADLLQTYADYYPVIGYKPPWIGYVAFHDGIPVGSCGFKGGPKDGKVELAYWTFPEHEGKGVAKAMCAMLVAMAQLADEKPRIIARTLREANPSTQVLRRCGFIFTGDVKDPDDGWVWEWEWKPAQAHS